MWGNTIIIISGVLLSLFAFERIKNMFSIWLIFFMYLKNIPKYHINFAKFVLTKYDKCQMSLTKPWICIKWCLKLTGSIMIFFSWHVMFILFSSWFYIVKCMEKFLSVSYICISSDEFVLALEWHNTFVFQTFTFCICLNLPETSRLAMED